MDRKLKNEDIILDDEEVKDIEPVLSNEELAKIEAIKEAGRIEANRLAEEERQADIKARWNALHDKLSACQQSGISNADLYFNQLILFNPDKEDAEKKLVALEVKDKEIKAAINKDACINNRRLEYAKIDRLLLEALAEKEEGRPEKMEEYLEIRAAIKEKHPK